MAGVSEFIARLQQLASGEVLQRVGVKVADAVHAECIRGFQEERDPYGSAWTKRKQPTGTWPILQKTGAGVDSLTARYVAGRVVLRIRGYFKFHQAGTHVMVARKVFPDPSRGLGLWLEPVNLAARDGVREAVEAAR